MARSGWGRRQRRGANEWSAVLSRFAVSGLSVAAFCEREGFSTASFYRWRGLLDGATERGEVVAGAPMPAFVDLGALGSPGPSAGRLEIKLDLGGGLVLSLVRG